MGIVALACVAAAVIEARGSAHSTPPSPPRPPAASSACPTAVHGLGRIAFVARGQLDVVDLSSCQVRRIASGRTWSPQFSPDGRWLAYSHHAPDHSGSPVVVPAGGGTARSPLGRMITTWWWAPGGATLYGD